jgi:hypothetical protein
MVPTLMLPMDKSRRHNEATIREKIALKGLGALCPAHSPDLSPLTSGHPEQLKE